MESLHIKRTKYTLGVAFAADKGLLELDGSSYPENAFEFFEPLKQWLHCYLTENTQLEVTVNLKLNYLNTSSSKCLYDILERLGKNRERGGKLQINWYYQKDDDMLEAGQELMDDTAVDMTFIAY
jgi:hypothetical protein